MERKRKLWIKAAVVTGALPFLLWAYEYGPDPGYCGVPGEQPSCAAGGTCHIGTANDKNNHGSVSVAFPNGMSYVPGVKQHLMVTIADPATSQQTWGFQLTARQSNSATTMAGSFAYTDANTLLMCSQANRVNFQALCLGGLKDSCNANPPATSPTCPAGYNLEYIEHSLTGYNTTHGTGSATYGFDWTPPATNVGNVVLYLAGNAGLGGTPTNQGSHIYTTTYTLTPSSGGGVPAISDNGVVSAGAFGGFTSVAPGSWMEIYGTNLSATTRGWAGTDFTGNQAPTSLDNVKVTIGGQLAFVDYVSPTQVNAQVPAGVATGSQQMTVTAPGGTSSAYNITVNSLEPGMLAPPAFIVGGKQYLAALFPDSTANGPFVLPPSAIPGLSARYAKPGDTILIYGVGFGPVKDSGGQNIPPGTIVTSSNTLANPFTLSIGGSPATLSYQGLAPNFVGLYQFNAVVPNIPNNDLVPVTFTLNGAAGSQTLYIGVHN
jgi:uncharacterized protein (TIGR03437 family)